MFLEGELHKVAVLALTVRGSFVLLGNRCLTGSGGSGQYQKIPLRIGDGATSKRVDRGVVCTVSPKKGEKLYLSGSLRIKYTSPVYYLYRTTENLPRGDALQLGKKLAMHFNDFSDTVMGISEAMRDTEQSKRGKVPIRREEEYV